MRSARTGHHIERLWAIWDAIQITELRDEVQIFHCDHAKSINHVHVAAPPEDE